MSVPRTSLPDLHAIVDEASDASTESQLRLVDQEGPVRKAQQVAGPHGHHFHGSAGAQVSGSTQIAAERQFARAIPGGPAEQHDGQLHVAGQLRQDHGPRHL